MASRVTPWNPIQFLKIFILFYCWNLYFTRILKDSYEKLFLTVCPLLSPSHPWPAVLSCSRSTKSSAPSILAQHIWSDCQGQNEGIEWGFFDRKKKGFIHEVFPERTLGSSQSSVRSRLPAWVIHFYSLHCHHHHLVLSLLASQLDGAGAFRHPFWSSVPH